MTPVVLVVFNRPRETRETFDRIRQQRPERLFIVADGPRVGYPSDVALCADVREIVSDVDWTCDVLMDISNENVGCKRRMSSGLDWVFSHVDRAIVLEDDCVAHADFFAFCDELLERYADDPRVAVVTGDNFQGGMRRGDASYYFSKYNHVWGWATWKRAWHQYDDGISFWPAWQESDDWQAVVPDPVERQYWSRIFDSVAAGKVDSWAYPWTASTWFRGGLTATPNVNLVTNVGFGPTAAHTKVSNSAAGLATSPIGTMTHPISVRVDAEADRYTFDHHFGGALLRERGTPVGFIRWFIPGANRVVRRKLGALMQWCREHRRRDSFGSQR